MHEQLGALRDLRRWIVWRPIEQKKIPVGADGRALRAWKSEPLSFEDACERAARFEDAGLGLLHGEGVGGIDLDDCRSPDGAIDPRALVVVERAAAYTEVSPSGKGLKIFGKSSGWLEMNFSDASRVSTALKPDLYFAVTGRTFREGPPDSDLTATIALVLSTFGGAEDAERKGPFVLPETIPRGTQNDTLFREACRHRGQGKSEEEVFGILQAIRHRCDPQPTDRDLREIARSACRYEEGVVDEFPLTESGDSEHFAALNAGTLCYDHRMERWLLFDGVRWRPQGDGEVDRLALLAMRDRQRRAVGAGRERARWAIGGEGRARRANMLHLAQSVITLANSGDAWDEDPWLLGVRNGVVDLRTGELRAGRCEDRITMQTRYPYDASAACPQWEAWLAEILKDDLELVPFVHRALGYSITGDCREEVFFMCVGDGRNGKGTLINIVGEVMGDYHDNLSFHSLERGNHGPKETTNDLAKLHRKRIVTAQEAVGGRFDESRVKSLTGRDPITARFLYREEFTFVPDLKLWLSVNKPPRVRDDSTGFWSRPRIIPFRQCYLGREDKTLKDRLRAEGPGILAWLVRGCLAWQGQGLPNPDGVKVAIEEYRASEDVLGEFYDERCVVSEAARCRPSELFDSYVRYCDAVRARNRLGSKGFSQQVAKRFRRVVVNGAAHFAGVGLMSDGAEATEQRWEQI